MRAAIATGVVLAAIYPSFASEKRESPPVTISRQADRVEIGNAYLCRSFSTSAVLATRSITNRLTGRCFPTQGEEFVLDLGQGRSIAASQFRLKQTQPDAARGKLAFELLHEATGIRARLLYELRPEWCYLRKRLELETGSVLIRRVDVEQLRFPNAPVAPTRPDCLNAVPVVPPSTTPAGIPRPAIWDIGLGQPLFVAGELFLGLEHPAGHNGCEPDGRIFLRHYPGRAGRFECKPAVLGVAANQPGARVRDTFLAYLDGQRPRRVSRFTEFFFDAHRFDDQARQIIDTARDALVRRGVKLDCVTINGWAEPTRGIMEPPAECPDFLRLLSDYARRQLGCPLGLHIYTTGRRSHLLRDWIAARFDMVYVQPGPRGIGAYCLADPRAESLLTANLGRYVRDHGVAMYYYDWGCFACPGGNHRGHMPGYGTEAIADAFLRHLAALRAAKPDIFLCDTGWYSPWWLTQYDGVYYACGGDWNGNLDGPPSFSTVDLLGSYRDRTMKERLEARPYYPATGYIDHGAISHDWMTWVARAPQPRKPLVDYVAMMFLLGPQIAEYILALPELSEANRDDLAAVHRWGLARDPWLLADTRPCGGGPMRGEIYGFSHITADNSGLIGLRNPTVFDQSIKLCCDESLGFRPSPRPFTVITTYPHTRAEPTLFRYGDSLELELAGNELRVVDVAPQDGLFRPVTLGAREELISCDGQRTVIAVLGGCAKSVRVVSPSSIRAMSLDGASLPVQPGNTDAVVSIPGDPPAPATAKVEGFELRELRDGLSLRFASEVPTTVSADLVLAFTSDRPGGPQLQATIRAGDAKLQVESPHLELADSRGRQGGRHALAPDWRLFRARLPSGHHEVSASIRCAGPAGRSGEQPPAVGPWLGNLHAFLDWQRELPQSHRLEIHHARLPRQPLPALPLHWNRVERTRLQLAACNVKVELPSELRPVGRAGSDHAYVEVDSFYPGYTAAPITDGVVPPRGKAGQAWASADESREHFVRLSWPESRRVGKVYICWGQDDWLPRAFRVECRVDGKWIRIAPAADAASAWQSAVKRDTVLQFSPLNTDCLRIVQAAGGGSSRRPDLMGVAEVAVYPGDR